MRLYGLKLGAVALVAAASVAFTVPPLTGPVIDEAGIISPAVEADLDRTLRSLARDGSTQLVVLTVNTLDGEPIEQASIKVVDTWKLGSEKADNGVLLLIAVKDRQMRIEVGQGLEGDLPDAYARRIVDDVIGPAFKQGNYDAGVANGVGAILKRTDPSRAPPDAYSVDYRQDSRPMSPGMGWPQKIILMIIIGFLLFTRMGRMILFSMLLSGGRGRGGRGGGGGFSGGGGGFSGGGASGRW